MMDGFVSFVRNGESFMSSRVDYLLGQRPGWDGKLTPGDTFELDGETVRVSQIDVDLKLGWYDVHIVSVSEKVH